jgi:CBS domain-containing membrane protein
MNSILEIMSPDPITLSADASLAEAGLIMQEKRIRHIPIVGEDKALAGLITQRDILAAVGGDKSKQIIKDVMQTSVYTIGEEDELRAAAIKMQKHKIGSLPVMRNNQLVGIITDSDYVSLAINLLEQMAEMEPDEFEFYDDEVEELSE